MKRKNSGSTKIVVATTLSVVALVGVSIFSIQSFAANSKDQGLKQSVLYEDDDADHAVSAKLMDVSASSEAESTAESETVAAVVIDSQQEAQPAAELEVVDSKVQTAETEKKTTTVAAPVVETVSETTAVEVVDSKVSDQTLEQAYEELAVVDSTVAAGQEETTAYVEETFNYIEETPEYIENTTEYIEETPEYVEPTTEYVEVPTEEVEVTTEIEEESTEDVEETAGQEEETAESTDSSEEQDVEFDVVDSTVSEPTTEETTTYEEETAGKTEDTDEYVDETTEAHEDDTTESYDDEEETSDDYSYDEYVSYNADLAAQIVNYAYQWVGVTPYIDAEDRWSEEEGCYMNSLTEGTDCSGFTQLIYGKFGIYVSAWSNAYQYGYVGTLISCEQLMPGDIVVYDNGGHVAIYAGEDTIIHCSNPDDGTKVSNMWYKNPTAYVRVVY